MKRLAQPRLRALYRKYRQIWLLFGGIFALASTLFVIVIPWQEEASERRVRLEQEIVRLRGEIAKVDIALGDLQEKGEDFTRLLDEGWLATQDRLAAARIIERLATEHSLARLDYQFQPERRFTITDPKLRGVTIIETQIHLSFNAMLDLDLSLLFARLQDELDGSVDIKDVAITRRKPLELADLLALEAGEPVALLDGTAALVWRTLLVEGVEPIPSRADRPPAETSSLAVGSHRS
ncbi:MAG: hypothetical protein R3C97_01120 [Geminicoccaceae bacterium]